MPWLLADLSLKHGAVLDLEFKDNSTKQKHHYMQSLILSNGAEVKHLHLFFFFFEMGMKISVFFFPNSLDLHSDSLATECMIKPVMRAVRSIVDCSKMIILVSSF